jgi:hypothetical protein
MNRKPVALTLSSDEAETYDTGGDDARHDMAREYAATARALFATDNVSWIEVTHPDGFVVWYYDRSPNSADD